MLKERLEYLEYEYHKLTKEASQVYLRMVTFQSDSLDASYYDTLKERLISLQCDITVVKQLLADGYTGTPEYN